MPKTLDIDFVQVSQENRASVQLVCISILLTIAIPLRNSDLVLYTPTKQAARMGNPSRTTLYHSST